MQRPTADVVSRRKSTCLDPDQMGVPETEADSSRRRVPRGVEADKRPKRTIPVRGPDPRPVIVDQDVDTIGDRYASQPDMVAMAARVADQIAKASPQRIRSHRHHVFERHGKRQRRSSASNRGGHVLE